MLFYLKVTVYKTLVKFTKTLFVFLAQPKPTVYVGENATEKLCASMAQFGMQRVLIVTDEVLVKLGVAEKVEKALIKSGLEVFIFDGVTPDPTYTVVENTVATLNANNCDSILALGGGSAIDAAKVAALCATNPDKTPKSLGGFFKAKHAGLPFFAIPTTAGTGSEATIAAVISDPVSHAKTPVVDLKVVPIAAALDPTIMAGMPPHITAATGMDALTHAIEAYIGKAATKETDRYALAAVKMIFKYLPRAYDNGQDMEAREAMALASFYAGLAFTRTGVGYVHAIAHNFGGHYGTPHGLANAIVLPYILEFYQDSASERMAEMATATGIGQQLVGNEALTGKFIEQIKTLNNQMAIPSTLAVLKESDIKGIAKAARKEAHFDYTYPVPKYFDQRGCETIIRKMLP